MLIRDKKEQDLTAVHALNAALFETTAEADPVDAVSPHDVPDVGRICIVAGPTGAIAHLMQPLKQ